ncbi:MAG: transglutaminase domain protein [Flavipsychrobacter sp.]|nr:transglutaminase domain protein [Flavipsychrobacter sp.]
MKAFLTSILFVLSLILPGICSADNVSYKVDVIPAQLLKRANAVVRNSHYEVRIVSASEVHVIKKYAITVLNDKGADYGKVSEYESSFIRLKSIKGRLYDKDGIELDEVRKKDIKRTAPYSFGSISDVYYNTYDFGYGGYPYTCEYEIETVRNMTFYLPAWEPKEGYDCAVESADVAVIYPQGFPLRYHSFHIPVPPEKFSGDGENKLTAYIKDAPATLHPGEFAKRDGTHLPEMMFAIEQFELTGKEGSMATWNDIGKFVYELNAGRDILPDDVKVAVHLMADTCKTKAAKVNVLYDYLKKNTRYVSIQLGIGGWQTFDAKFVAEKGYGDCKALSNYMKALLKEVGITSYQALVSAGSNGHKNMIAEMPCTVFNHAILCVPGDKDSMWVECTSKSLPAGYLSSFTDERNVLLLTNSGGYVVRTPGNADTINILSRTANIVVAKEEMKGKVSEHYSGYEWENEHYINDAARSDIGSYLNSKFSNGMFSVQEYSIVNNVAGSIPYLDESMNITGEGSITESGTHLFIAPYIFSNTLTTPPSKELFRGSFEIHHSYTISDTLTYQLEGVYAMDNYERSDKELPFAVYKFSATLQQGNMLQVIYSYSQKKGTYPEDQCANYIKLYKEIVTDFNNRLVLSRKD